MLQKVYVTKAPREYKKNLSPLIIQMPRNKGFISSRPYLWFYMVLDKGKNGAFSRNIKNVFGEKPIYLDTSLTRETVKRFNEYNFNKGYFDATVAVKSSLKHNKIIKLYYEVELKDPHYISDIKYVITDSNIKSIVEHADSKPLIATGKIYDSEALMNESVRITSILNNNGYYKFSKNYVYYEVDTATYSKEKKVTVILYVQNLSDTSKHKQYFIRQIYLEPDYKVMEEIKKDTATLKEFTYITNSDLLKPSTFYRHIRFASGDLFSQEKVKQTINLLSDIQYFKYIDISYAEKFEKDSLFLDCIIKLSPMKKRGLSADVEINTTAQNKIFYQTYDRYYGMAGSVNIRNRNIFRQAIQLSFGILGAFDVQSRKVAEQVLFGNYQLGVNTAMYFPTAYLPKLIFDSKKFQSSKTAVNLSFFYEHNSDFDRTTSNLALIYQLNKKFTRHFITPLELSLVKTDLQPDFAAKLSDYNDPLLNNIFETHLLTIFRYNTTYNDKPLFKNQYWAFFTGIETAGNLGYLFNRMTSDVPHTDTTTYTLAGLNFFQYIKGDVDVSYHSNLTSHSSLASRINVGIGIPYGNSNILPFEKRYFIGGGNSIRAWAMREIGPGTYKDTTDIHYEQSGGLKIEGSLEYRFDIYALLKGALFLDAGNVWNLKDDPQRDGDEFKIDKFVSDLALGTGFGLRFDFTFFIFRLDLGIPLYDPSVQVNPEKGVYSKWVINDFFSKGWIWDYTHLNLAIGYPF